MIKEIKKEAKYFYGYSRNNNEDATSPQKVFYKLTPHSIGRLISKRQIIEYLVGQSIVNSKDEEKPFIIHPLLSFVLSCSIYYHHLTGKVKKTKLKQDITEQNTQGLPRDKIEALAEHIESLFYLIDKDIAKFPQQVLRIKKLVAFKAKCKQYGKKYSENMKQYYQKDIFKRPGTIDIKLYFEYLMDNAERIDFLTVSEQTLKLDLLYKKIKQFYVASKLVQRKKGNKAVTSLKINRPSVEIAPVLQNLFDNVELRKQGEDYRPESIQMIKSIFIEMKRFQTVTSAENKKSYYEFLSPETIIFDQFKLAPKLHYEPIVMDMFGLSLRPTSIQNRIVFNPTPQDFNCFQSVEQLQQENQLMLNDPYYGNIQMYDGDKKYFTSQRLAQLEQQKTQIQNLKQKMQVSRLLSVSYYLINSNQFGRLGTIGNSEKKKKYFQDTWRDAQLSCSKDMSQLQKFFGLQNKKVKNKKFNFQMEEISDYLQIQKNDSMIQRHRNVKTKRYFILKNIILRQITRILSCENVFTKIYNVKKRIFIYLLTAIEIIQESIKLVKTEKLKSGQRKNLRIYLQNNIRRHNKNPLNYLDTAYEKIQDYKNRDQTNIQAKYLRDDDLGKKTYAYLVQIHKEIKILKRFEQTLNSIQGIDELKNKQHKDQYKKIIKTIDETAYKILQKINVIFLEAFHIQLKNKHKDGPHKISQEHMGLKQFFKFITKKLELLVLTYLTLNEQNFITYQSLIYPLFKIQQNDNKRKMEIPSDLKSFEIDKQLLQTIQGLIDITKLTPKKIIHLKQSNLIYIEKKGPEDYSQIDKTISQQIL